VILFDHCTSRLCDRISLKIADNYGQCRGTRQNLRDHSKKAHIWCGYFRSSFRISLDYHYVAPCNRSLA